jgi:chromosome segregation ATPase
VTCAEERDDAMRQAAEGHVQVTRVKIEYDARLQTTLAELQETVEALAGAEASIAQLVHDNGELRARLDAQAEEHAGQHSAVVSELDSERERLVTEARRLHESLAAAEERVAQAQQSERVAMETAEQAREEVRKLQELLASRDAEMAALKDEVQAQGARLKAADRAREEQIERSSSAGSLHGSDSTSDMQWARREAEYLSLVNGLKHRVEELEAAARDKDAVVATVHSNAQTLSRIMAQNKDLKQQLAEIQERFVYVTQQQAEHMLAKEAAEHDARQWRVKAEALEAELDGETDVGVAMVDNEKLARAQRHAEQLAEQVLSLQKDRLDLRARLDALAEQLAHAQAQAPANQHAEAPPAGGTTEQGAAVPAPARENGDAEARELELLECIEQLNVCLGAHVAPKHKKATKQRCARCRVYAEREGAAGGAAGARAGAGRAAGGGGGRGPDVHCAVPRAAQEDGRRAGRQGLGDCPPGAAARRHRGRRDTGGPRHAHPGSRVGPAMM